jgi:hypothetical protein
MRVDSESHGITIQYLFPLPVLIAVTGYGKRTSSRIDKGTEHEKRGKIQGSQFAVRASRDHIEWGVGIYLRISQERT